MQESKNPLRNEPGRRYTAQRVQPRAGMDMRRAPVRSAQHIPQHPAPMSPAQAPVAKSVDGVAKPAQKPPRQVNKTKPAQPRQHRSLVLKRHIVERAEEHRKEVRREHKKHFATLLATLAVIMALGAIAWSFWDLFPGIRSFSIPFINHSFDAQNNAANMTKKSSLEELKPSENDLDAYQVPADAPRILSIPKLNIAARVKQVGSSLNGEPISPNNIFDVGWYDDSSKPGQPGAMLINGHMSGATKDGVFHDLGQLAQGDLLQIERGDGVVIQYVVSKVQSYDGDQLDISTALQSIDPKKNGLNLMTSSANYDGGSPRLGKRVMIFAIQK